MAAGVFPGSFNAGPRTPGAAGPADTAGRSPGPCMPLFLLSLSPHMAPCDSPSGSQDPGLFTRTELAKRLRKHVLSHVSPGQNSPVSDHSQWAFRPRAHVTRGRPGKSCTVGHFMPSVGRPWRLEGLCPLWVPHALALEPPGCGLLAVTL